MTELTILKGVFLLTGGYIAYEDFRFGKIPKEAVYGIGLLLILWIFSRGFWEEHLICGLLSFFFIFALFYSFKFYKKVIPLGGGDLKLFPLLGAFNTLESFPFFLIYTGLLGIFTALFYRIVLKREKFPLGPALMGGGTLTLFYVPTIDNLF